MASDIKEYSDDELKAEVARRKRAAEIKLCSYCGRSTIAKSCRFYERHEKRTKSPELEVGDTIYELTQAFCEGALALFDGVPYNVGNPYDDEDDRHEEWSSGHEIADDEEADFTKEKAMKALAVARKRKL